jgi:hypothetical protein
LPIHSILLRHPIVFQGKVVLVLQVQRENNNFGF